MKKIFFLSLSFLAVQASPESPVRCAYNDPVINPELYKGPIAVIDLLNPKGLPPLENAVDYVGSKIPTTFPQEALLEILTSLDEDNLSDYRLLNKLIADIRATEIASKTDIATSSNLGNQSLSEVFGKTKSAVSKTYFDLVKELEAIYGPCKEYIGKVLRQHTTMPLENIKFPNEQNYQDWLNYLKQNIPVNRAIRFIIENIGEFIPGYNNTNKVFGKIRNFTIEDLTNKDKLEEVANLLMAEEFSE